MRARQTGQLLVAVIVLIVVIGAMVIAVGFLAVDNTRSATVNVQSGQALYAANSGLEYAAYRMRSDTTAFATTCTNLNNVTQTVDATLSSSFTLTTTSVAAASTTLSAAIGSTTAATPISVASAAAFPSHGRLRVDSEEIVYTGKTATTFTGLRRGAAGSAANTHLGAAPVNSEAQCVVRATGSAGTAARVVESSFLPGTRSAFQDGTSVAIGTSATTLTTLATTLPAGDNVIVAVVALRSTNTTRTDINAGNLVLRNATTGTTLASNQYVVRVGGTATIDRDDRSQKTHFLVAIQTNANANQTYDVRATGTNANATGEAKILVFNNMRMTPVFATANDTSVSTGAAADIASVVATGFPGTPAVQNATNFVIATVQINNNANGNRNIAAGNLTLARTVGATTTTLVSNQFNLYFRDNQVGGNPTTNQEYSFLLLAMDSDVAAAPTYRVRVANASGGNLQGEAKIAVFQGPAGAFVDGGSTAFLAGSAQTTLATVSATALPPLAPGASVALIASVRYYNNSAAAGGPFSTAVGAERIVYNSASQSSNAYQYLVCNTGVGNECRHFTGGLLWQQTFANANPRGGPTFQVQSASSSTAINGESKALAIYTEPVADRVEISP
jgi:hypothetical protein